VSNLLGRFLMSMKHTDAKGKPCELKTRYYQKSATCVDIETTVGLKLLYIQR